MPNRPKNCLKLLLLLLAIPAQIPRADTFSWRSRDNQVDADIRSWNLAKVLQTVAVSTGWRIYVEPGTNPLVSVKFSGIQPSEALPKLLGNLNYALQKQTGKPAKLFVYQTSISSATELIETPPDAKSVDEKGRLTRELIITLKPEHGKSIEEIAKNLNAKVVGRLDDQGAYRLEFESAADAERAKDLLQNDTEVAEVDSNYQIQRPPNPEALALASPLPLKLTPKPLGSGSPVVVGLIDTAVQPAGSGIKDFLLPQLSMSGESPTDNSTLNHGTAMASTILRGISITTETGSTSARILPVDVYGPRESTSTYDVARGIVKAVQDGANIINLSLGSSSNSPFLRQMISDLHAKGVLFVGAAGNEPTTAPSYPAAYPEVIAVTAGDRYGKLAEYANRGDFVDIVAPGSNIIQFGDKSYMGSGTSFAAAYISGVAAAMANDSKTPLTQLEAQLRQKLGKK